MTPDILLVLTILGAASVFFITGWIRMDLTALLVVVTLAVTGLVSPAEALAGFSSPAAVTVAGMFVLSAGLARTGVAALIGRRVLEVAGQGEARLLATLMLTAGVLSGFMNNIGVAAFMLPVVMDLSRRTGTPPSRLLLPLALACLMGGLMTLVGTPPNIVASDALVSQGLEPFGLFDFTPVGLAILGVGTGLVVLGGRHLLPARDPRTARAGSSGPELAESYDLQEKIFRVRLPSRSHLDGKTLAESRLRSALGLHVLAIQSPDRRELDPGPEAVLRSGDRLLVQGRPELLTELRRGHHLEPGDHSRAAEFLRAGGVSMAEAQVPEDSALAGRTLNQSDLRSRKGVLVLALRRGSALHRTDLEDFPLQEGDLLLLQGPEDRLQELVDERDLERLRHLELEEAFQAYALEERFLALRITPDSILAGRTLEESRLGDAAGLTVLGIRRDGETEVAPDPQVELRVGDLLLVKAKPETLQVLRGLLRLRVEEADELLLQELESDSVGLVEVVLAPRTKLVGRTPRQVGFREKYGLTVLGIGRGDELHRTNLRDLPLQFGDSILLFGSRRRLKLLAQESDFLVLSEALQDPPRTERAPLAAGILVAALLPVLLGWVSIGIAVMAGATAMILSRCLSAEEAYRSVEWPAVVLIGGMIPMGTAMHQTGAALMVAEGMVGVLGDMGPRAALAGLALMTAAGAQVIPSVALVVIMAPIAIVTAADLGVSPHAFVMGVALSAASLSSPVAHPVNVLVMGPGGYRYSDYLKLGVPLTGVVLILVVGLLPIFLPFTP